MASSVPTLDEVLDEVLFGALDDDFGLSEVTAYTGKRNLARREVAAVNKAVSSEPTEDHNDPGEFSAVSAVPSVCYDSGSKDDNQEEPLESLDRDMASASRSKPLWIFFDVETTGLSPMQDRIIEMGAVAVGPPEVVLPESYSKFSRLVKSTCPISLGASQIHNLHDDDLADQKPFSDMFQIFLDWITTTIIAVRRATGTRYFPVLVAHNGFHFDFPCLLAEMSRVGADCSVLRDKNIHFSDTLHHFRQLKKSGKYRTLQGCELNLQALCETYFPHMEFEGHRALADAEYTSALLMDTELQSSLRSIDIRSVDDMKDMMEDKKPRSDLRRRFGVESWQGKRLGELGLTCAKLQDIFEECQQDSEQFKIALEKQGVNSEALREKLAGRLLLPVMTGH